MDAWTAFCSKPAPAGATITPLRRTPADALIGFSNRIRGAERLTAPQAFGDPDNDMSCHARKYGTGGSDSKTWGLLCDQEKGGS